MRTVECQEAEMIRYQFRDVGEGTYRLAST